MKRHTKPPTPDITVLAALSFPARQDSFRMTRRWFRFRIQAFHGPFLRPCHLCEPLFCSRQDLGHPVSEVVRPKAAFDISAANRVYTISAHPLPSSESRCFIRSRYGKRYGRVENLGEVLVGRLARTGIMEVFHRTAPQVLDPVNGGAVRGPGASMWIFYVWLSNTMRMGPIAIDLAPVFPRLQPPKRRTCGWARTSAD